MFLLLALALLTNGAAVRILYKTYFLLQQVSQYCSDILAYTDRLPLDLPWASRLSLIDAGIDGVGVFGRHLPERILDDDRRVVADTHFKEKNLLPLARAE